VADETALPVAWWIDTQAGLSQHWKIADWHEIRGRRLSAVDGEEVDLVLVVALL
jgi:hypothetical protein